MAYTNLINQACTNKAEFFKRMRDFICKRNDYSPTGIGWTLHDAVYAVNENSPQLNDYFVVKSDGESGRDNMYILVKWANNYILFQGWLYWDNSTHIGTQYYGSYTAGLTMAETISNPQLWIYGDLNAVFIGEMISANGYSGYFGKLQSVNETEDIGYCSSSISAGNDKSITVDISLPSDWIVGAKVFIWDNIKIEVATIKTVNTGTKTITVDIVNNYTGTFRISRFLGYVSTSTTNLNLYALCSKAGTLTANIGTYVVVTIMAYIDQMNTPNRHILASCYIATTGGIYGKLRNIYQTSSITPLVHKDIFIDIGNNEYRYLHVNSNKYLVFKEI